MFVLHVDLLTNGDTQSKSLAADKMPALEEVFATTFRPAIDKQSGFVAVTLLRSTEDTTQYRLVIAFESRKHQQQWTATDLHGQVWPQMAAVCDSYSVRYFEDTQDNSTTGPFRQTSVI